MKVQSRPQTQGGESHSGKKICRSIDLVGSSPTNPIERVIYMITKAELIENIEILADKCEELIKERDQARRLVCKYTKKTYHTLKETAELRGWDCYKKENGK